MHCWAPLATSLATSVTPLLPYADRFNLTLSAFTWHTSVFHCQRYDSWINLTEQLYHMLNFILMSSYHQISNLCLNFSLVHFLYSRFFEGRIQRRSTELVDVPVKPLLNYKSFLLPLLFPCIIFKKKIVSGVQHFSLTSVYTTEWSPSKV